MEPLRSLQQFSRFRFQLSVFSLQSSRPAVFILQPSTVPTQQSFKGGRGGGLGCTTGFKKQEQFEHVPLLQLGVLFCSLRHDLLPSLPKVFNGMGYLHLIRAQTWLGNPHTSVPADLPSWPFSRGARALDIPDARGVHGAQGKAG